MQQEHVAINGLATQRDELAASIGRCRRRNTYVIEGREGLRLGNILLVRWVRDVRTCRACRGAVLFVTCIRVMFYTAGRGAPGACYRHVLSVPGCVSGDLVSVLVLRGTSAGTKLQ